MRAWALTFAGAATLLFGLRFPDPGVAKAGRIVIDDSHSFEWEQAARRLDESYFGDFSTYSYATMTEHLAQCYDVTVVAQEGALIDALVGCDVLLLKTPETDYTIEEVRAIHRFVQRGGGLIAIGDHTNLFGMNVRLNAVIGDMGILLRDDSARRASDQYFVVAAPPVFARHPAVASARDVMFMTGCSVWTSRPEFNALIVTDALCDPADYINPSAFPSWSNDASAPSGRVCVVAAAAWGQGRVIVFTDGTPLSSFDYFKQDYPDLVLSLVAWANRKNGPMWPALLVTALGVALLGLAFVYRAGKSGVGELIALTGGAYAGLALVTCTGQLYYPPAREFSTPPDVGFIQEGCFAAYPPSLGATGIDDPHAVFDTLYNVPLRLGRRSRLFSGIESFAESPADTAVLVNVVDAPSDVARIWLCNWVERGGHLVIFQRAGGYRTPGIEALLGHLNLQLSLNADRTPTLTGGSRVPSPDGVIALRCSVGAGRIDYIVSEDAFCNASLGHSMSVPNARQADLYQFLFRAFRYDGRRCDFWKVVR